MGERVNIKKVELETKKEKIMNRTLALTTIALLSAPALASESTIKMEFTIDSQKIYKTISVSDSMPTKVADIDSVTYLSGIDNQEPVTSVYKKGVSITVVKLPQESDIYSVSFEYFGDPQISEYIVDGMRLTKVERQEIIKDEMMVKLPLGEYTCSGSSKMIDGLEVEVQKLCLISL